jgi:hypothetical protein
MRLNDDYDTPAATHGMQKVEGILALERSRIILEEEIFVGDSVIWFELPDGKLLVSKAPEGVCIEKITPAYFHLEAGEVREEK